METPCIQKFTQLLNLKERIFHDFPAADISISSLTCLNFPTDNCSYLLFAAAAYHVNEFVKFSTYLQNIDVTLLSTSEIQFFTALQWISRFQTEAYCDKTTETFEAWLLQVEPELRILTLCHFLKYLSLVPSKFQILKQKLLAFTNELEALDSPISVRGFIVVAHLYTAIFDDIDASVHCAISGFHLAKKFSMPNFEFTLLSLIGEAYVNNNRFHDAMIYFEKSLELTLTYAIHPLLLTHTYFQLTLSHISQWKIEIADRYYLHLSSLMKRHNLTEYSLLTGEVCQLFLQAHHKSSNFADLWSRYVQLSERYLQFTTNNTQQPPLEPIFLQLEAFLHEQFTFDNEQLLYTYYAHLNYYRENTPAKYFSIALLFQKLAKTYKKIQDFQQAWNHYQHYAEMLNLWEKQTSIIEFSSNYAVFEAYLHQQKLQRLQSSCASLNQLRSLDPLTQLYSRNYLNTVLQQSKQPTGCAILDLDFFKNFNDTHGHQAGDMALQQIANIIQQTVSPHETAFRYGGEEFLILSFDDNKNRFEQILKTLNKKIAEFPLTLPTQPNIAFITASIGAYWQNKKNIAFNEAFQHADLALYTVKNSGRNHVVFYNAQLLEPSK
ncbi:MAG: GGDEF domain-containing protein [Culicoidibacterales bacterium]